MNREWNVKGGSGREAFEVQKGGEMESEVRTVTLSGAQR